MARVQIAKLKDSRQRVKAEINYIKNNGKVVKLIHVNINGILVNHVWIFCNKEINCEFKFSKNKIGKNITFDATISTYYKTREGIKVLDYCLTGITNIELI